MVDAMTKTPMSYKQLGLENTKAMFAYAGKHKFAVPAYNFNNMEQLQAIVSACIESDSPFILQVSHGARKYADGTLLRFLAAGAVAMIREKKSKVRFALHLDHGDSFELAKTCIDNGFSSVMIDASHLPYEENITLTKKVVEYAHKFDVSVEGELGVLAGIEDDVKAEKAHYTDPKQVVDFVKRTGVDSLAISIGTSHGAYKFKPDQCKRLESGILVPPPLRFDILEEVGKELPAFPIVLHGASSVLTEYVQICNKNGGKLDDAVGVPEDELRKAASLSVRKINVDSDGRLVITAMIRKVFAENPSEFDPRKYLGPARDELKKVLIAKNKDVMGSAGSASKIWAQVNKSTQTIS